MMSGTTQAAALNMYSVLAADENDLMPLWNFAKKFELKY